jgi:hypothetical protein
MQTAAHAAAASRGRAAGPQVVQQCDSVRCAMLCCTVTRHSTGADTGHPGAESSAC